jgi:hypothetical protein
MDDQSMGTVPGGYLQDSSGRLVPMANVKPADLLEDELVREAFREAQLLSIALRMFREKSFGQVQALLDLLAQSHGLEKGGAKGNITLSSYDGNLRLQVAIGDSLTFGPELQVAKQLVDKCIVAWSEGANANLRAIVNDAFAVDKEGKLNVDRILGLRRLDIADQTWKQAMEAIGNAVRVVSSKRYLRFYRRAGADQDFAQLPLDLARV